MARTPPRRRMDRAAPRQQRAGRHRDLLSERTCHLPCDCSTSCSTAVDGVGDRAIFEDAIRGSDKTGPCSRMRSINRGTARYRAIASRGLLPTSRSAMGRARPGEDMIVALSLLTWLVHHVGEIPRRSRHAPSIRHSRPAAKELRRGARTAGARHLCLGSRADPSAYTAEWKTFVEGKYGTPPVIEYSTRRHVDNRDAPFKRRP